MSFVVYRSSAGSGKTYTLVREYLKIVLQHPELFRNILALTFTNKAANEMKERLMQFLSGLSKDEHEQTEKIKDLASGLAAECALSPEQLRERAARVLSLILHHYSDLAVGTIDSFVAGVIRTFARDLHLPQNFEIELDKESLINQAVDTLIQQVGKDDDLTQALLDFTLEKADNEKGWNIEKDIAAFSVELLFKEEGQQALEDFKHLSLKDFALIRQKLFKFQHEIEDFIFLKGFMLFKMLTDNGLTKETFYQGNSGIFGFLQRCSTKPLTDSWISPNSYIRKAVEEDIWFSQKPNLADKQTFEGLGPRFKDEFRAMYNFILDNSSKYLVYKSLYANLWTLSLLHEVFKVLEEIKSENNILPIGEFNRRIAEIVLNEPIPFIYERLGERYHYFLIDEFQDTSILQWQNMLPLIENALSEGYPVILVGDGKQAIYRWRGGEVEQFSGLPDVYRKPDGIIHDDREAALQRNYKEEVLGTNYRSGKVIVDFNNEFFCLTSSILNQGFRTTIYLEKLIRQSPLPSKPGGMVSVEFIPAETEEVLYQDLVLSRIQAVILELMADGYSLGDIAILGRNNDKIGITADYLISKGIAVQSPDVLLLTASGKVSFLISCLKWIARPVDRISGRALEIFLPESQHWQLESLLGPEYLKLPVYDLCEVLIRHFALNDDSDPYLLFFLDAVHQFSVKNEVSIIGFLEWWDLNAGKLHLLTPSEVPAVRIMTVHKAKGLQFPVVILPFVPRSLRSSDYLWVDMDYPELPEIRKVLLKTNTNLALTNFADEYAAEIDKSTLEYLNLLYVAMTRPEERLYILSNMPSKTPDKGFSTADFLARFITAKGHMDMSKPFLLGEKTHKAHPAVNTAASMALFELNEPKSINWKEKLFVRYNYPAHWDVRNPEGSRDRGKLLHMILSKVATIDTWEEDFEKAIAANWLETAEKAELHASVFGVISHPELKDLYSGNIIVLSEKEILLPDGKVMRPDRVVSLPGRTAVIDYKTGDKADYHLTQIRSYTQTLDSMSYPGTEAYLVYLDGGVSVVRA